MVESVEVGKSGQTGGGAKRTLRKHLMNGGAVLVLGGVLMVSAAAHAASVSHADTKAEAAPAEAPAAAEPAGDIVVTGTRIVKDGFTAPTPVAVLSSADIKAQAPANLSDFVNQMPSVTGGSTSGNSSGSLSSGLAGINSVNLRGLGAGRTLVLIDGQRSVSSAMSGVVDVNTVPQDLVERVEVVTGGASAQYGSDAVGGVVNFILNKKYKGFRISADQGISSYGDAHNWKITASAGFSALDDRLHVLLNGEYDKQDGVSTIDRTWNNKGYFKVINPNYTTTNGQPYWIVTPGAGPSNYTTGGLINTSTNSALVGTYFLGAGQTGRLNYGSTASSWMQGGDWQRTLAGHVGTNSLVPNESRASAFGRAAFDVTSDIQIFGQFSFNRYIGQSYYQQTPSTGVTIKGDNAYLQSLYPAVSAALGTSASNTISVGTSNAGFPVPGSHNTRDVYRYVAGASGKFALFGRDWKFDAYFQHGQTKSHEQLINTWNTGRMALAQDAVFSNGKIVCRSTLTDPTNGCVPINRLGTDGPSPSALAYIYGEQPWRDQTIKQDVASVAFNGDLFRLPGGTAAVAFGGEWRREGITGYVPSQFQSGWLYGNYLPNNGHYYVKEGFGEIDLPLFKGLNINGAVRGTDYSTSGSVVTWKAGATWQAAPIIKFRGTYSHDIRAPNLQELFVAGTARTNTVSLPATVVNGVSLPAGSYGFLETTIGNTALKPEKANAWSVGTIITPPFIPGFSASFDYYDINIQDAIGSVTSQNTVDFCYGGQAAYCNNIIWSGSTLQKIIIQPFNFASQHEKGFDIDASYRTPLSRISDKLPGTLTIRGTATHYISNVVDNGIFPVDYAGVNGSSLAGSYNAPSWSYRISAFYDVGPVSFNVVYRGFSDGVYGNDYTACTSGCPTYTSANDRNRYRTINTNSIAGASYVDFSATYKFHSALAKDASLTFVVNNLFDKDPVLIGNDTSYNNTAAYAQTNRSLYDVIGRTFRVSAKFGF